MYIFLEIVIMLLYSVSYIFRTSNIFMIIEDIH